MADKAPALIFQPAPRATPRVSQAQADQRSAETADLGFGRVTSSPPTGESPSAAATAPTSPAVAPQPAAPVRLPSPAPKARSTLPPARPKPAEIAGSAALKFEVPGDLWTALKVEAAQRRVTVKFLVLEALSKQGYAVDLDAVPEDGRRLR